MTNFADLGLTDALVARTGALGYETPTDIQLQAIPALLQGNDVVGVAQTGTGKTAAFGLPLLTKIDQGFAATQALVLAPTRELAMQVADAIADMAEPGVRVLPIYGGSSYGPQLAGLREGAHVVVGTPGRVIDMLKRKALKLSSLTYLVLDEADEMLQMGFAEDVDEILTDANPDRQTALFSATMPHAIRAVARQHMVDPIEVTVQGVTSTTDTVTQEYAIVPFRHKLGALSRVLAVTDAEAAIVFVRTRKDAEEVGAELISRGVNAATISGDVPQNERERIVERLRQGTLNVLVATDVAARGLDVDRVGLVVNFDVPREAEAYVHRIGRTGRAGRSGLALTFFTPRERSRLRTIEKVTRAQLTEVPIPSPRQVSEHRATQALSKVHERIGRGRLEVYREHLTKFIEDSEVEPLEVAAALLATSVGDSGPEPRAERRQRDENRSEGSRPRDGDDDSFKASFEERSTRGARTHRSSSERGHRESGFTSYRVEVGHKHGVRPGGIVGAIANEGGLRGSDLGKIKIFDSFAIVDISTPLNKEQINRLRSAEVAGNPLKISLDTGPRGVSRGGFDSRRSDGSGPRRGFDRKDRHGRGGDRRERQYSRPTKRT